MARITVEDCLDNIDNIFEMVLVAAKRARRIAHGSEPMVELENDKQYLCVYMEREKRAGRYGTVVKAINKILAKEFKEKDFLYPLSKSKLMEERAAALGKLGFAALVDRDRKMRVVACPKAYALF